MPDSTEAYISSVTNSVFEACRRARSKIKDPRAMPGNIRLGLEWLKKCPWIPIVTDKDGGFCMISKTTLIDLKEGILRQQCYKPQAWHDRLQSEVMDEHAHACKRLAHAMKDQSLFPALLHDWWSCKTSLFSVLQVTIKTHKDPGEVEPRQLHTTPYHPMRPAMRFISWQLNKVLRQQHHIIRDSADFAKKISSITVPSDALIVRFDVRDFYMTGMHEHLIAGCKANIDPEIADEVGDLLNTTLSNQFVWREPSSIAHRVKLG